MTGVFLLWIDSFLMTKRALVKEPFSKRTAFLLIILTWIIWILYVCSFLFFLNDDPDEVQVGCLVSNGFINRYHLMGLSIVVFLHLIILITLQCSTFFMLSQHIRHLTRQGLIPSEPKVFHIRIKQNKVSPSNKTLKIIQHCPTENPLDPRPGCSNQFGYMDRQQQQDSRFLTVRNNFDQRGEKHLRYMKSKSDKYAESIEQGIDSLAESAIEIELHPNTYYSYLQWTKRMSRFAKLISLVLLSFIACYTPFFVCLFLYSLHPGRYISGQVNYITSNILVLNSITNVFVYLIKSKDYRKAFKHILTCKKGAVPTG
ncbi:unnamed protein product [Owenia fusiformis]|uniref:G-protein coupled receptors family 1 profile domain-containing protein n=1 Tax=Owenia fusiformis TaxID=6347 RepID=A0A8S4PCW8_OWEFU|nr:unnamed protein product [Owenia fusiformis]